MSETTDTSVTETIEPVDESQATVTHREGLPDEAAKSPVLNPPHAFSEGEEVITPEGAIGKVVSIDATDPENVRFEVIVPMKQQLAAADLKKA